MNALKYNNFFI